MEQHWCARALRPPYGCELPIDRPRGSLLITTRPFAVKFGRRPVYLLSTLLMGVACIWLGVASSKSYTPFLVGRAFLGIFEAPIESIAPSTITDIFFLHNRGEKVSMYGLSVLGGNELGPMLSAL
jgi:MFS family permease